MKIRKSNIYVGSTLNCTILEKKDPRLDYFSGEDMFKGSPDKQNEFMIRINGYYVILDEITGPHDFHKLLKAGKGGYDARFLRTKPHRVGERYVDMGNPPVRYFIEEGELSLKDLKRIQALEKEAKEKEAGV